LIFAFSEAVKFARVPALIVGVDVVVVVTFSSML
jgi:hypothetical protein